MKISRKIFVAPFLITLITGQVCFAASLITPPSFAITPSALLLPVTTVTPPAATTPPPASTTPPIATTPPPSATPTGTTDTTTVTDPTPPPATPPATTDPNGTVPAATPPASTVGTNGTPTDPTVPPRGTNIPTTPPPTPESIPPRTNNIPTEEPVIDILDVPLETTQEQCSTRVDTPICPAPGQIAKALTPILTENQLKMALLVFFGGGLGALLWVFSANIMDGSQMKREEARFDRQQRASNESRRLDQLSKTYGRLSDTIASLYKESGSKLTLTKDALKNYLSSSIELEMYGSEESLAAHKEFLGMITSGNSVTKETFEQSKNNLISALKKDLGLT